MSLEDNLSFVIARRHLIPEKYWDKAQNGRIVVWLLDQANGTAGDYEASEERVGFTHDGEIIWGFSSGCSCWDGWKADEYNITPTWKEFLVPRDVWGQGQQILDKFGFSKGWQDIVQAKLDELMKEIFIKEPAQ